MLQPRSVLTKVVAQFGPVRFQFRKVMVEEISFNLGEESESEIYVKRQKNHTWGLSSLRETP